MATIIMTKKVLSSKKILLLAAFFLASLVFLFLQNIIVAKSSLNSAKKISTVYIKPFDPDNNVLVFLHVQKTGGSDFDRAIVRHLLLKQGDMFVRACEKTSKWVSDATTNAKKKRFKSPKFKKHECVRKNSSENWYFSRQTLGWVCGLHPDITDLKKCVHGFYPNKTPDEFHLFTILRDPFHRYISEWQHVSRGATWIRHKKNCLLEAYERCFTGRSRWENATLDEFMNCKYNLASNRQTRMLAFYDSELGRCQLDKDSYESEILRRAKLTLKEMRFFALNEYQHLSQLLFEKTFGPDFFKFEINLAQTNKSLAAIFIKNLHDQTVTNKIKQLNRLDIEL